MRRATLVVTGAVALVMVLSVVALPFLGGGVGGIDQGSGDDASSLAESSESADRTLVGPGADGYEPLSMDSVSTDTEPTLAQNEGDAVEAGVEAGIELAQSQGVEITQEQRAAALEGATASAAQHQEADVEQVQEATAGAVHGSLMQEQAVEAEQIQVAVGGATEGALAQHQTVSASQMQSATWGATHGAVAQHQRVTVEQLQVATYGAAAGAAAEAGEKDVERAPKIQEAAQGSAYGVLEQYQKITVEQRQQVTVEHVQHAAAGAASGAIDGSTEAALEADQRIEIEQRQEVTVKQIQKAATGAAKGALVQRQEVAVEQTQATAHGAAVGPLKSIQTVDVEQVQRVSITQVQEASFGAAKGAIVQSQEATIEQIQIAADGGAQGALVQHQEVSISQVQAASTGAAKGAVDSAVQQQIVEVEQIQAAAFGAGEGAVLQRQVVDVTQVQALAEGASSGTLLQYQEATIEQIQYAAASACAETAKVIQYQQVSVTQLQILTQETASDATAYAVTEGIDDRTEIVQYVEIEVAQKIEEIDELEGEASISFADQESEGETVTIDEVSLSEGGFVAVYDGVDIGIDPEGVIGQSAYLEAGDHEDVEIELEEPLEEDSALLAAVHHDTTGDETFQYVESDGADDEPYVTPGGAPVVDSAFVSIADDDPPEELEATLSVSDQVGDGETLLIDEANASVAYSITAEYDGETSESDLYEANESVTDEEIELEPPIEESTTVDVGLVDEDGTQLATETIEYELEEPLEEPEATLTVTDQSGNGSELTIDEASATIPYALTVHEESDETNAVGDTDPDEPLAVSDTFEANETVTDESLELEPPLEENATLNVSVVSMDEDTENGDGVENGDVTETATDGEVLESETIEYTVEPDELEFDVDFLTCTEAEVTGSFEDGDQIIVATAFYESGGIGNTMGEYAITVGEDIEAPFEGTIVYEPGEQFDVTETDEEAIVAVPEGDFGAAITGFASPEATPGSIDYPNPEAAECIEEVRPEQPTLSVEETTPTDDGIEVVFGYDNPNDADLIVDSELEGATETEPPTTLEPGEDTFIADWTPEEDEERLAWIVDMGQYDYDEPIVAETATAGEIDPSDPAEFTVDILEPIEPVEQGEELTIEANIENVGDEGGTQSIELEIDGIVGDPVETTLAGEESQTVSFTVDTTDIEPGEYEALVSSENDSDTAFVGILEPPETDGNGLDDGIGNGEPNGDETTENEIGDDGAENDGMEDGPPDGDDGIEPNGGDGPNDGIGSTDESPNSGDVSNDDGLGNGPVPNGEESNDVAALVVADQTPSDGSNPAVWSGSVHRFTFGTVVS